MLAGVIREAIALRDCPRSGAAHREHDRALVGDLLRMKEVIDLVVPRGGAELIRYVADTMMPVLTGGIGVCHTYVDAAADVIRPPA
jgi:glutamate-5-semialdehyde dehydrogenase